MDYLNALVALRRVEVLLDDFENVAGTLEAACPEEQRWAPWFGAEAISYYSVGYVTCLEWHAKSRLVDLLNFKPEAIRISDVQKTVSDKLIVQMVSERASVSQLVGAAVKVSSLEAYLSVVSRAFDELDFPCCLTDWLTGVAEASAACWLKSDDFAELSRVFEFRHALVHELGVRITGHPNVRDSWSPGEARRQGRLVASLITGIEAAFTQFAPETFPNLLDENRTPINKLDRLRAEFVRLDRIVTNEMQKLSPKDTSTLEAWIQAQGCFATYADAEENFISIGAILHWRYHDARTPLVEMMLQYRINFLKELLSNFSELN
ncbi:hypothetical protein [Blastomonas aquatica]|uniref:RiboL-PSP-HEPN domain-containing protein n=1 Tax=Blastomonas aquatica TaxID=1510276 RepID=A0ABQ1J307_9SPHN|nr:hypothetical protein [Blastomonas aquatica]GGB58491.1 hypothetical protein GCM10010833_11580 [Blastomonas aquatica]